MQPGLTHAELVRFQVMHLVLLMLCAHLAVDILVILCSQNPRNQPPAQQASTSYVKPASKQTISSWVFKHLCISPFISPFACRTRTAYTVSGSPWPLTSKGTSPQALCHLSVAQHSSNFQ